MGWRRGEVWLDIEVHWFREAAPHGGAASLQLNAPAFFGLAPAALASAIPNGLAESRRRRAEHRRRRTARKRHAAALVIGPAVILTVAAPRLGNASRASGALEQDPPSQTLRPGQAGLGVAEAAAVRREGQGTRDESTFPAIRWREATSHGLPYAGSLAGGTQLPVEGPDWVTWDPIADRVPNRPHRLYGNDRIVRTLLEVIAAYRGQSPDAPRVVVGDLSFRGGGPMELHRSHQNGLDVDVYYPRRDGLLRASTTSRQVDRALAQDLVDRFVAAGAEKIFVGYSTGLRGPDEIVVPYPSHEDHMHVRFPSRAN